MAIGLEPKRGDKYDEGAERLFTNAVPDTVRTAFVTLGRMCLGCHKFWPTVTRMRMERRKAVSR